MGIGVAKDINGLASYVQVCSVQVLQCTSAPLLGSLAVPGGEPGPSRPPNFLLSKGRLMNIILEFRNPTPSHCEVAIFLNGAHVGVLRMRQDEVGDFHQIVAHGCARGIDQFMSKGSAEVGSRDE